MCGVGTAARVIRGYVGAFAQAPAMLDLVASSAISRREFADSLLKERLDPHAAVASERYDIHLASEVIGRASGSRTDGPDGVPWID